MKDKSKRLIEVRGERAMDMGYEATFTICDLKSTGALCLLLLLGSSALIQLSLLYTKYFISEVNHEIA